MTKRSINIMFILPLILLIAIKIGLCGVKADGLVAQVELGRDVSLTRSYASRLNRLNGGQEEGLARVGSREGAVVKDPVSKHVLTGHLDVLNSRLLG